MIEHWTIIKNVSRYPGIAPYHPDIIFCVGTLEQARQLAEDLSNYQAGCDYAFYVEHDPEDEAY